MSDITAEAVTDSSCVRGPQCTSCVKGREWARGVIRQGPGEQKDSLLTVVIVKGTGKAITALCPGEARIDLAKKLEQQSIAGTPTKDLPLAA